MSRDQLSLLSPRWVCDYCGQPEDVCRAARDGLAITMVDANNPESSDDA